MRSQHPVQWLGDTGWSGSERTSFFHQPLIEPYEAPKNQKLPGNWQNGNGRSWQRCMATKQRKMCDTVPIKIAYNDCCPLAEVGTTPWMYNSDTIQASFVVMWRRTCTTVYMHATLVLRAVDFLPEPISLRHCLSARSYWTVLILQQGPGMSR